MNKHPPNARTARVLRWIARIWSAIMAVLVLAMFFTPDPASGTYAPPNLPEDLVLALAFPGLTFAGFLISWRYERLGGALIVGSFPLFTLILALLQRFNVEWLSFALMGLLIVAPGILFLLAAWLEPREGPAGPTHPRPGLQG